MGTFCDYVEFHTITPGCCNVPFAMSDGHYKERSKDKDSWYCPNCGTCRHFIGESEEQKQINKLKRKLEYAEEHADHLATEKTEARKMYNRMRQRIQKGVCPCCDQTFPELRKHMTTAHDLTKGQMVRALRQNYGMTQENLENETGVYAAYVSQYENGRPIPEWATNTLENWSKAQIA